MAEKLIIGKSKKVNKSESTPDVGDWMSELRGKEESTAHDQLLSDVTTFYSMDCAPIDIALGGGIPAGRILEVFGFESNGKTTFTLEITKAFTSHWATRGEKYAVLWVETEMALDRIRATYMHCDMNKFVFKETSTVEDTQELIVDYIKRAESLGIRLLITWDTLASAQTKNSFAFAQGLSKKEFAGGQSEKPRIINEMLRTVTKMCAQTGTTIILVNQAQKDRDNPNAWLPTTPGGGAVKFFSTIRIWVNKAGEVEREPLPDGREIEVGYYVSLHMAKNKITLPRQTAKVFFNNERGIDRVNTVVKFLQERKHVRIAGSWKYLELPESLAKLDINDKLVPAPMTEFRYQNSTTFAEAYNGGIPHLKDWVNYKIYLVSADVSPLLKVRLADKIWGYEMAFFGEKRMPLTDEEQALADMIAEQILNENDANEG